MKKLSLLLVFAIFSAFAHAANGDTMHVVPHNKSFIATDPAKGVNEIMKWAVFPSEKMRYRKIIANISLQCPEGMKCGAWDYLDYVFIRRKGSVHTEPLNIELVRILTPYGGWFDSTWKFTWRQDVTDWSMYLRDSVEIGYQHTGYESNDKIGWLVTVDFAIVEGPPVMEAVGHQRLWNASLTPIDSSKLFDKDGKPTGYKVQEWSNSFAYGDSSKPFDKYVKPIVLNAPDKAAFANIRMIQTGHGMDEPDGCSEFCSKWREVFLDGKLIDHKNMFIVCGYNPVFPQAGTWVYSRGNWCPGSLAIPDIYTMPLEHGSHTVDLKMEPYHSVKPQGGWLINASAFYYKAPAAKNDVAMEQIIAPGIVDEFSRMNPVCSQPRIKIKNNGAETLKSLTIVYGISGQKKNTYVWKGNLPFLQTKEIVLPGTINTTDKEFLFEVNLQKPNGKNDFYEMDNKMTSKGKMPPFMEENFIVSLMPNKDSVQTSWQIKDENGNIVYERQGKSISMVQLYNDTLHLQPGCYSLHIFDSENDGLSFWANPKGGYGFIRLLNGNGQLIKNFDPNFGSGLQYYFSVKKDYKTDLSQVEPVFEFFPTRTSAATTADIVMDGEQDITFKFYDQKGVLQMSSTYYNFSSKLLKIDISGLPPSFYSVVLTTSKGQSVKRSIRRVEPGK